MSVPTPTDGEIRDAGFSGDITRFPLSTEAYEYRCRMNGVNPMSPPNPAWFYAPNAWVQSDLEKKAKP